MKIIICPKKEIANQILKIVCGALICDIFLTGLTLEKKYKLIDANIPTTIVWLCEYFKLVKFISAKE